MIFALYDNLDRVRAERVLDAAAAAAYPHLTKSGSRQWLHDWTRRAQRVVRATAEVFSWNGRPVTPDALKQRLRQALGDRFSAD